MGEGLGGSEANHSIAADDDAIGPHDSTILESLYSLGFLGSALYLIGLLAAANRLHNTHPSLVHPQSRSSPASRPQPIDRAGHPEQAQRVKGPRRTPCCPRNSTPLQSRFAPGL